MLRTIAVSESLFDQLDREAQRSRLSPNALAERLARGPFERRATSVARTVRGLLTRVHTRMTQFDSAEIENDITEGSSEVKAARLAHGSR